MSSFKDHVAFARLFSAVAMHLDDDRQIHMQDFEETFMALFRIAANLGVPSAAFKASMAALTDSEIESLTSGLYKKKGRRSRSIGSALHNLGSGVVEAVARRGRAALGGGANEQPEAITIMMRPVAGTSGG